MTQQNKRHLWKEEKLPCNPNHTVGVYRAPSNPSPIFNTADNIAGPCQGQPPPKPSPIFVGAKGRFSLSPLLLSEQAHAMCCYLAVWWEG